MEKIVLFVAITDPKRGLKLIEHNEEKGRHNNFITRGRGTAGQDVLDYLGLGEPKRYVIFSVMTYSRALRFMRWLKNNMLFDVPGNGIAFAVKINSVAGGKTLDYFLSEAGATTESREGEIQAMSTEYKHELIIAITARGHVDDVMSAAREAKASGGTVIHARGTGAKLAEKFFGVTISAEKEIIFIVASTETKSEIMKSIAKKAGLDTEARTISFSVPVSEVLGIREHTGGSAENDEDDE